MKIGTFPNGVLELTIPDRPRPPMTDTPASRVQVFNRASSPTNDTATAAATRKAYGKLVPCVRSLVLQVGSFSQGTLPSLQAGSARSVFLMAKSPPPPIAGGLQEVEFPAAGPRPGWGRLGRHGNEREAKSLCLAL